MFLAKGHVPRESHLSHLSTYNKGDNEMTPRAVHRSPGIYFTAEENPGKPQLGETVDEGSANSHILKWGPLPPNEVGRITQHIRNGRGRKEGRCGWGL